MFVHTEMTEHLMSSHGISPRMLRKLWKQFNRERTTWDNFLEINHDLLHALENGEAVRGVG